MDLPKNGTKSSMDIARLLQELLEISKWQKLQKIIEQIDDIEKFSGESGDYEDYYFWICSWNRTASQLDSLGVASVEKYNYLLKVAYSQKGLFK